MRNLTFISFPKFHFLRRGMFILLVFLASEMALSPCESSQTDSSSGYIFNSSCLGWFGLSVLKCPPQVGLVNHTASESPFSPALCLTFCWCYYTLNKSFLWNIILSLSHASEFEKMLSDSVHISRTTFTWLAFTDPHSLKSPSLSTVLPSSEDCNLHYDYFVISLFSRWSLCLLKAGLRFSESCASGMLQDLRTLLGFSSHEGEDQ